MNAVGKFQITATWRWQTYRIALLSSLDDALAYAEAVENGHIDGRLGLFDSEKFPDEPLKDINISVVLR